MTSLSPNCLAREREITNGRNTICNTACNAPHNRVHYCGESKQPHSDPHSWGVSWIHGSKAKASSLPPHHPYNCTIVLPGATLPYKVYPLSLTEQWAMKEYVEEALQQVCIRPSTLSVLPGSFFNGEKMGRTSYLHWLPGFESNHSQMIYPYLLLSSSLKQLCSAWNFLPKFLPHLLYPLGVPVFN